MQSKVSMVMPCYNKVSYIGAMLDSVIAQEWDNIELILVNDGSTDGTREVIAGYELKLRERGYDIIIIDQENRGCCAAVYAGLLRMTGDYFCLVDCDDEIMPEYVSRMAGWLDGNDEYEWAACSYIKYTLREGILSAGDVVEHEYPQDTKGLLERWLFRRVIPNVWIYMVRVSYIKKCRMVENWCCERRKTYEPLIGVPLMAGKGRIKYFREGLYRYNMHACDLYRFDKYEDLLSYYDDALYLYKWTIKRLNVSEDYKKRLSAIALLSCKKELFMRTDRVIDGKKHFARLAAETASLIDELFEPPPRISADSITEENWIIMFKTIETITLTDSLQKNRLIGYGALGRAARRILPELAGTIWYPSELWDENGDGENVKKPDFDSLCKDDIILMLPTTHEVIRQVVDKLKNKETMFIHNGDLPGASIFPQLKKVRLKR